MVQGGSLRYSPRTSWDSAYRYINLNCGGGSDSCRRCLYHLSRGYQADPEINVPPGQTHLDIWITPNFFRFADEARAFLNLPPANNAEVGLYLGLAPQVAGNLKWAQVPGGPSRTQPGGGLEFCITLKEGDPAIPVIEWFMTIPGSSGTQPPSPSIPQGANLNFRFCERR